jgi:HAD superfamily hydrolase (TIGR01509 family)
MKSSEAVIFDMDGVIVDSEPRHERAYLEVLKQIGYFDRQPFPFAEYIGRSDQDLWVDFVRLAKPPYSVSELLALKGSRTVDILRREQPLFDGLTELVRDLANRYPLALASGSDRAIVDTVLAMDGLRRYFKVTVSSSDIQRGKPAPDIFLRAAELLGIAPERCWVIEDSKPGVAAGLAAGMRVIAVTNTHPAHELAPATHVVSNCAEIGKLLLESRTSKRQGHPDSA